MTDALETIGLGRRYRSNWGLRDCSLQVREGSITGLVGPNGAGKSTLLRLAAGLSRPTVGSVRIFGEEVDPNRTSHLARTGYLDQLRPLYGSFRVKEMLTFGRRLNDTWDDDAVRGWLAEFEVPLDRRVGRLSLGQQAQVALALCMGKRPDLLLLDEPVAALDPLARRQLLQNLLATVAERGTTVFLSSHIVSELAPVCDELIILSAARVQTSGTVEGLLAEHRLLVGPRLDADPPDADVVSSSTTTRQTTLLVRGTPPALGPDWQVLEPGLEEIVLAYLANPAAGVGMSVASTTGSERDDRMGSGVRNRGGVVIWLAWRRHRTNLLILAAITAALIGWMLLIHYWFDESLVASYYDGGRYLHEEFAGPLYLQPPYQVEAVNVLLLLLPCLAGLLVGVPLVAGELDDHTNRLAWTQKVTRTRWFLTKFAVVVLPVAVLAGGLSAVGRWWSPRVIGAGTGSLQQFAPYTWFDRIHPAVFTVLRIVPVAYTLFAVALGTAVGALLRRTPRAAVATIVVYLAVLVVMALVVRPTLTSQIFLPDQAAGGSPSYTELYQGSGFPWMTGQGFRFVPGSNPASGASADTLGTRCDARATDVDSCYRDRHIEHGSTFLSVTRFWALQWRGSAFVLGATVLLLAAGLWSVRRWRA